MSATLFAPLAAYPNCVRRLLIQKHIVGMAASPVDYPIISFGQKSEWVNWLEQHHANSRGVWLRLAKATSGQRSVTRADALDAALCFGWIDGQARSVDADFWDQKFTPRGKRSVWSKRNREHVERLAANREMRPPGLAAIEAAKADGRWQRAYDSPSSATVPEDFQAALDNNAEANAFFKTLKGANRYGILYRIQTAVKPETRAKRIAQFTAMLQRRETLHP